LTVIIPSRRLRDIFLSHHAERCPRCGANLLSKNEARPWFFDKRDIHDDPSFWPAVRDKIGSEKSKKTSRPMVSFPKSLRWASIAALFISIVAGIWLVRKAGPEGNSPSTDQPVRFRLDYLRVDGRQVDPVVIQPADSDLVIIWVEGTR
jgi:hypothetical protein